MMLLNKKLALTCFLIPVVFLCAQSQQVLVDSLERLLKSEIPDTARLKNMIYLAMYYEAVDTGTAHKKYTIAKQMADEKKLPYYKGIAFRYEATLYYVNGQYARMLENLDTARLIFNLLPEKKVAKEMAALLGDYGNYYNVKNEEEKAAEYFLKSAAIEEKNGFKTYLIATYQNLYELFRQMGQADRQKDYSDRVLKLAKELGKPKYLFSAYLYKAHYFEQNLQYPVALIYLDSAQTYRNDFLDQIELQLFINVKASAYQGLKQYDSAVYYFKVAYDRAVKMNLKRYQTEPLLKIGYNYLLQKKYLQSEQYLNLGLQAGIKDSSVLFEKEGYESLSRVYSETNRYKQAYEYYKIFHSLTDSLVGDDKRKFTLDLEKKYETSKKEQEIKTLQDEKRIQLLEMKQKNTFNYILIGSAIALLLFGGLVYRNFRQKQLLQQQIIADLQTEKKLSDTEAILKGEEQERTRLAKDLHDGLSGMLSGAKYSLQTIRGNLIMTDENQHAFERSMDMLDNSIKEIRRVAQNMMPEALIRFGLDAALKDHCIEINKTGILTVFYQSMGVENVSINQTAAIAVYRIVQELLNNVIKHAEASRVLVQLLQEENKLIINVEDDGVGFDASIAAKSSGMGWGNINSRVEYLQGKVDIKSLSPRGTAVNIEINLAT